MTASRKNVYFTDQTLRQLGPSGSLSGQVARIIDRYYEMCRREPVAKLFSPAEFNAICDACLSWSLEPAAAIFEGIALEVADALPDGLADKWGIDGPALVAKIEALTPSQQVILADQIEAARS